MERFPLTDLPSDIRKIRLIEELNPFELLNLCGVNQDYANLCRDIRTWNRYLQNYFGITYGGHDVRITRFLTLFLYRYQLKPTPIQYQIPRSMYLHRDLYNPSPSNFGGEYLDILPEWVPSQLIPYFEVIEELNLPEVKFSTSTYYTNPEFFSSGLRCGPMERMEGNDVIGWKIKISNNIVIWIDKYRPRIALEIVWPTYNLVFKLNSFNIKELSGIIREVIKHNLGLYGALNIVTPFTRKNKYKLWYIYNLIVISS